MKKIFDFTKSTTGQQVADLTLATLWMFFLARHLEAFFVSVNIFILLFVGSESLQILLFLLRKKIARISKSFYAWAIAAGGTFTPLLFSPNNLSISDISGILIVIGVLIQISSLASLNEGFGIVAAERVIKTTWMYKFVRHPIYMSYLFTFTGYLIENFSVGNCSVWASALIFMFLRIIEEEQLLSENQQYREYKSKVRYRLIPFIY